MRIVVSDYSGHPFQVQLSRALAARGHDVLHLYSAQFQTPKGALIRRDSDPDSFAVAPIDLGEAFAKYDFVKRFGQERRYGRLLAERVLAFRPDAVISSNLPLDAQKHLLASLRRRSQARFLFWLQDIYSAAIARHFRRKWAGLGRVIGARYRALEAQMLRDSDHVIAITEDFAAPLAAFGVAPERIAVIENWAPLDELPALPRDTAWAREHGLADRPLLLYSGTLGLKHNPQLFVELARSLPPDGARLAVISEGPGADFLAQAKTTQGLEALHLLPFQPFDRFPEVMASADVLLAILEPEAGVFSVPSKILSYLCAGRPILAAMPADNLAARLIRREGAGAVVDPGDDRALIAPAAAFLADAEAREAAGQAGRAYAERTFEIARTTDRFEELLAKPA